MVLVDGALVLYVERGGATLLSFTDQADRLAAAAAALATTARRGTAGRLTLRRIDGADLLDRDVMASPVVTALTAAGFGTTPQGLRLRAGP